VPAISGLRVLLLDTHPSARIDTPTRAALDGLVGELVREGARVERANPRLPESLPDLAAVHKDYVTMLMTITTYGAPGARDVISAHDWFTLIQRRDKVRRQWRALFGAFDVVLAPVFGTPAFPLTGEADWSRRRLLIDGEPTPFGDQLAWAGMATFAGLPATVAPIATSPDGLPIGVQIIGAFLHDLTTIALAHQFQTLRAG